MVALQVAPFNATAERSNRSLPGFPVRVTAEDQVSELMGDGSAIQMTARAETDPAARSSLTPVSVGY